MKAIALSFFTLAFSGCIVVPEPGTPAADPNASAATGAPMPRSLGEDAATRKTNELLAAVGADKLEGLKPMDHSKMGHGGMEGMDHSKMAGTEGKPGADQAKPHSQEHTPGMDHSKMPGKHDAQPAKADAAKPADAAATAEEMKKTADEMKKAADAMKAKSDEMKQNRDAKPAPKAGDHSQHQPNR